MPAKKGELARSLGFLEAMTLGGGTMIGSIPLSGDPRTVWAPWAVLAGLLIAGSSGCSEGSSDLAPGEPVVRDSAGVILVENFGEPEQLWRTREAPLFRVGESTIDPEGAAAPLHQVTDVLAHPNGSDYIVAHAGNAQIEAYRSDGTLAWARGSRGDGPGDFEFPMNLWMGPGDTIAVFDPPLQRITRLTPEGELVGTTRLDVAEAQSPHLFLGLDSTGRAYTYGGRNVLHSGSPLRTGVVWEMSTLVRRDHLGAVDGEVMETPAVQVAVMESSSGDLRPVGDPLLERRLISMRDETVAIAFSGRYEIRLHDLEGGLGTIVRRDIEARPITGSESSALRSRLSQIPEAELPRHHPVLEELVLSGSGELWVQRAIPSVSTEGSEWDIFEGGGRLLGTASLPPAFRLMGVNGFQVIGVQRDSLDREAVVAYELVPADDP